MIKKITLIIVILVLLVFSSGCGKLGSKFGFGKGTGTGPDDNYDPISVWDTDIHKGTKGLEMSFVKSQPPDEVWENSDFQIALEIKNEGAIDIGGEQSDGMLYVSGYNYIELEKTKSFEIKGKTQFNPEGGRDLVIFPVKAGEVEEDEVDSFMITVCYRYETTAGAEICINPNVLDIAEIKEKECKPSDVSLSGGQGAPVAVTRVEEEFILTKEGKKILLKIHISNKGNGKLTKPDEDVFKKACAKKSSVDPEKELNVIRVRDVRFSTYSINADPDYRINCTEFIDGSRYVRIPSSNDLILECSAILRADDVYTTPLTVELEYGYVDYITKAITIKDVPES